MFGVCLSVCPSVVSLSVCFSLLPALAFFPTSQPQMTKIAHELWFINGNTHKKPLRQMQSEKESPCEEKGVALANAVNPFSSREEGVS